MPRFALCLLFTLTSLSLSATELQPFKAHYHADMGSVSATATRELTRNNGYWELSQKATNFFAKVDETSQFRLDKDQQLVSHQYEYLRKALGSKRHALLKFDWDNNKVSNDVEGKPWSYTIKPNTLDKLNFQLRLRLDLLQQKTEPLVYAVADGGVLKKYRFKIVGEETIDTKLGQLNTVKVQRIYGKKTDKETWLWFSKTHDYLLVKYIQTKDKGKKKTELTITDIEG